MKYNIDVVTLNNIRTSIQRYPNAYVSSLENDFLQNDFVGKSFYLFSHHVIHHRFV